MFVQESTQCDYLRETRYIYTFANKDATRQWVEAATTYGANVAYGDTWAVQSDSREVADNAALTLGGETA